MNCVMARRVQEVSLGLEASSRAGSFLPKPLMAHRLLESLVDAFSPIRVYVTSINQLRIVLF